MTTKLNIGKHAINGKPVLLEQDSMRKHWMIVGGTGRGKSKLLEARCRYHIQHNQGMMVLDPHGSLYDDLLAFATTAGYRNRIASINPNETEYAVGINFLSNQWLDDAALASQVMKAIAKVFGQNEGDVLPRLERWQRNLLMSLIAARLTLADMLDFLSTSNPLYRQAALQYVQNSYVHNEWTGFDAIKKRSDMENLIEAPLNRAAKLILSDPIRRILGQNKSTIDIGDAIERGKIVLVNLAPKRVSRECQQVLGILLVDQVVNYAFQRSKKNAMKPFNVIVDEAGELTSNDLPYSLQALRKYGIFFTLCFQTLAQTKEIPAYYENLMSNTDVKIAFKTSRVDAEELIGELYAGKISGNRIKDELHRTLLTPTESRRVVKSKSESESESQSESEMEGMSDGNSHATGIGDSSGFGSSEVFLPSTDMYEPDRMGSYSSAFSIGNSKTDLDSYSSGIFSASSTTKGFSKGRSRSTSIVPFYEYVRESELANRQYFTVEEIKEKYIAWIQCQPMRHAQIKIGDNETMPIITKFVRDVKALEKDKRKTIARSNAKYALPAIVVDRLIEERRFALLEQPKIVAEQLEEEIENARWQ
ncbi:MAG: TraM recognition domain-containing protein [Candidatus Zixiibacteriota bacterium]